LLFDKLSRFYGLDGLPAHVAVAAMGPFIVIVLQPDIEILLGGGGGRRRRGR